MLSQTNAWQAGRHALAQCGIDWLVIHPSGSTKANEACLPKTNKKKKKKLQQLLTGISSDCRWTPCVLDGFPKQMLRLQTCKTWESVCFQGWHAQPLPEAGSADIICQ